MKAENLKKITKSTKKKKEILAEINKLGNQDLRVLQSEVNVLNKEMEELKKEWEEFKKPINDEILG